MKDSMKNRRKKLLALLLSAMMLSSATAMFACSDDDTSSSTDDTTTEETTEVKDEGLIKNAGFETFNDKNAINTSATGWSRSVNSATSGSALSSKAASGILDLSEDAWKNLTGSYYDDSSKVEALSEAEAEAVWDKLTVRDKLAYYDAWKEAHKDGNISKDLSFYESINIDSGDIPAIERFDTHEGADAEDTKVLMIHNEYPESDSTSTYKALGTAQKYTSSSTVTVKAGTSAEFSVWVRTQDLKCSATDGSVQDAVGKGAYISVTHSVGGKSLDAYMIENINTQTMNASELTNGWAQYTFLLKGSSYTDTTFSVVLGLGQGGGTYRGEYVNGYAFFDDIECNIITNEDYDSKKTTLAIADSVGFDADAEQKTVDVSKDANKTRKAFAMDFHGAFTSSDVLASASGEVTTSEIRGEKYSTLAGDTVNKVVAWGGLNGSNDVAQTFDNAAKISEYAAANNNAFLTSVYNKYFDGDTFMGKTLLLMSENGVAYEANTTALPFEFKDPNTGDPTDYLAISFFVKTSDLQGFTGAGITLVDGKNETSFSAVDTTDAEKVDIGEKEDIYNGWQQCFFFVENASDEASTTFTLKFNFGPTEITVDSKKDDFHAGFAAFTNFEVLSMSKAEYESAQSGTYAKIVSVKGDKEEEKTSGDGFDTAKATPTGAIEKGLANLQNYKGVYSNSQYITGKVTDDTEENLHENAGLISKKYFTAEDGYFNEATGAWFDGVKSIANGKTDKTEIWNEVFGKETAQPLFIWTDAANNNKSYGYIGKSTSIAANTYTAVSVRVKVGGGANAVANLYLVDTDSANYDEGAMAYDQFLSIGRNVTFWYDKDGNICTGDPSKKATEVAFKLQTNGLYKANKNWDDYDKLTEAQKNAWFANLNAYEADPVTGNLMVAKNGASHNYNDYWNNEGMDGVAYYAKDGKFYADKACTIEVTNLSDVNALPKRFDAVNADAQEMIATVKNTNGKWATVTFYIHTGDVAKNYRLEVWSGTRDGSVNNATGDYVIFDTNNPGTAESNFTGLITEYKELEESDGVKQFDSVFSYFDTASYLRYNATLDENKIGNLYEKNYAPESQTDGVAYLRYDNATALEYTVFADYQYSEKTVTASEVESDDPVEDTTTDEETDTNIWLLISSLAIAIVLLLAILSIVIRKVAAKIRKKRAAQGYVKKSKKDKKSKN